VISKNLEMVFEELCHPCGACYIACEVEGAISEIPRSIGIIRDGQTAEGLRIVDGHLNIGEAIASPLVQQIKEKRSPRAVTIIDCPPGTGCPVVKAVEGSDFSILVTEPTPFGSHDLSLAIELTRKLGVPMGVVVNRDGIAKEYKGIEELCKRENAPILLRIPFDREIAEEYSRGCLLVSVHPELKEELLALMGRVKAMVQGNKEVRE
jgi:MinD superfamily P-loop ATPase